MNAELLKALEQFNSDGRQTKVEYKLYYNNDGKVITYTTENLPGKYIYVTREQFMEARPDVIVRDDKLVYTHKQSHVFSLKKNKSSGRRTSKYDINIITDVEPTVLWIEQIYDIK